MLNLGLKKVESEYSFELYKNAILNAQKEVFEFNGL